MIARARAVIGLDEFHQLLCLLCPDFPFTLVQNAARIDLHWQRDPERVPFGAFADRLGLLFFYSEFMNHAAQSFKALDAGDTGKVLRQTLLSALLALAAAKRTEFVCVLVFIRVLLYHSLDKLIKYNSYCFPNHSHSFSLIPRLRLLQMPRRDPPVSRARARARLGRGHVQRVLRTLVCAPAPQAAAARARIPTL